MQLMQKNKKIEGVVDSITDFPPPNAKVDDYPNVTDIFGDLFENKTMRKEDENFLNHLLTKITDAKILQIVPDVKYIPEKIEKPKPKFDEVVIKKSPDDEPLPDLDAYEKWLQKKLKTDTFKKLNIKPKIETIFPDIRPKTEKFLPEIKSAIKSFPIDKPVPLWTITLTT